MAFHEPEVIDELKPRVERALHWALEGVTRNSKKSLPTSEVQQQARKVEYFSMVDLKKIRARAAEENSSLKHLAPVHA